MPLTANLASGFLVGREDSASPLAVALKLPEAEMWLELSPSSQLSCQLLAILDRISHELIFRHC